MPPTSRHDPHDAWSLQRPRMPGGPRLRRVLWLAVWVVPVLVVAVGAALYLLPAGVGTPDAVEYPELAQGEHEPGDIEGVQTFTIDSREHVSTPVDYDEYPPVGGPHHNEWMNCGLYGDPQDVVPESAVHAMEHGTVWIAYDTGLPREEVEALQRLYRPGSYLIISPLPDLGAPIVATAWGKQLGVDAADDPRLAEFLTTYELGPQMPGHGGPCTGGIGDPQVAPAGGP